jgi:general secretion pathway protein F
MRAVSSFDYAAIDASGRERRGTIDAEDARAARDLLQRRNLYPVEVTHSTGRTAARMPLFSLARFKQRKMSAQQLTLFTRQLSTLCAVSPLEEALRTIVRQTEQDHVRQIASDVHGGVFEGLRLAEAMARAPRSFPPLYRAMVSAGEAAGTLPQILDRLADLQERQAEVRGRITAALAYPIVLTVVAMVVVFALMVWVVPRIVEQFDNVGQQLPLLTRIIISLSSFLANWWPLILAVLLGGVLFGAHSLRQPETRLRFDRAILRLPLAGKLIRDLHAARMARTLATMVASRLPLLEGLLLTGQTVHNRALRVATQDIAEAVRSGGSLSAALKRAGVFPPLLVYLTASGESSGQLDQMLERSADYLEREFDRFTATALSLLEPAIIVIMGCVVALIVLAILLPILQIETLAAA